VLAGLALLGAVSFYAWGQRGSAGALPTAAETAAAPKVAAPATAEAAATTRVSIALQANPPEAKLYLDDEALPANPTTKLLLTDGKAHVLRAEAAGFANATSEFSPTKDATVSLTLLPVANGAKKDDSASSPTHRSYIRFGRPTPGAPAAPAAAAPVTAAPTPAPATAAAPAKPDCSNPIFLDKDGIRRVRPECR